MVFGASPESSTISTSPDLTTKNLKSRSPALKSLSPSRYRLSFVKGQRPARPSGRRRAWGRRCRTGYARTCLGILPGRRSRRITASTGWPRAGRPPPTDRRSTRPTARRARRTRPPGGWCGGNGAWRGGPASCRSSRRGRSVRQRRRWTQGVPSFRHSSHPALRGGFGSRPTSCSQIILHLPEKSRSPRHPDPDRPRPFRRPGAGRLGIRTGNDTARAGPRSSAPS